VSESLILEMGEMLDEKGTSLFGAIEQTLKATAP